MFRSLIVVDELMRVYLPWSNSWALCRSSIKWQGETKSSCQSWEESRSLRSRGLIQSLEQKIVATSSNCGKAQPVETKRSPTNQGAKALWGPLEREFRRVIRGGDKPIRSQVLKFIKWAMDAVQRLNGGGKSEGPNFSLCIFALLYS